MTQIYINGKRCIVFKRHFKDKNNLRAKGETQDALLVLVPGAAPLHSTVRPVGPDSLPTSWGLIPQGVS